MTAQLLVEHGMESCLHELAYGTADAVIYVPGDRIIVVDFKYGFNVVEPDAPQLKYYGYLAWENRPPSMINEGEPKVIELWVVQPRASHEKGPIRRHITNSQELSDWFLRAVLPAMERTADPRAGFVTGSHCHWCPARKICPALKGESLAITPDLDPAYLADDELGTLLGKLDALAKYQEALAEEALRRARTGRRIPGRKLVRKKAIRVFRQTRDQEGRELTLTTEARAAFGDDAFTEPELRSPAGIEKLPGGKAFVKLWAFTPETGLTLAKSSDSRAEIRVDGDFYFGDPAQHAA